MSKLFKKIHCSWVEVFYKPQIFYKLEKFILKTICLWKSMHTFVYNCSMTQIK